MQPVGRSARISVLAPLGAAILAVSGGGCGGGEPAANEMPIDAGVIETADFTFEPAGQTVEAGTTVTWTNTGATIHNVKGPGFFSDAIDPGESYQHRFTRPGTVRYLCTLHPTTMRGTLKVSQ
jgi:plastocyanin